MIDLNKITPEILDELPIEKRMEVVKLIKELKDRKLKYPILDIELHDYQKEFDDALNAKNPDWTYKYKFIIFLWGNWVWKTLYASYTAIRKLMWEELCKKYWIPPVGSANLIKMYTTTWDNIRDNIDRKYLLWTWNIWDSMKFPWYINKNNKWEIVKTTRHDKEILKEVKLNNWAVMTFWTYDQGQKRLQWWEPDYTWMDELPTRFEDLIEIWRWTRKVNWQLLISATPTNYNKKIHNYIFSKEFKDIAFIRQVDSLKNTKWDHSWLNWLSEEEIKIRRFGSFTPPEWLVFKEFNRDNNVVKHFNPKRLWNRVKFYWTVDFWVNHAMAFLLIAIDEDWHIYVFDMYYEKWKTMKHLADWIKDKCREYMIELEYITADSAGARERLELKEQWINTRKVNKKKKEWNMSNRRGWIFRVNSELASWNLVISDKCQDLIDEFQTHHYSENWEDWTVAKTDDDACDARTNKHWDILYLVTKYLQRSVIWLKKGKKFLEKLGEKEKDIKSRFDYKIKISYRHRRLPIKIKIIKMKIKIWDKFWKLTVIEKDKPHIFPSWQRKIRWLCLCDCWKEHSVIQQKLINWTTKSCWCSWKTFKPHNRKILISLNYINLTFNRSWL